MNLNRSIFLTCLLIGALYCVVYVNSCYKINVKTPAHDFVADFLLGIGMLLAGALIVVLITFARFYQRGMVEFDHEAVESFGRRYAIFAVIGLFGSELLNMLFAWIGINSRILLNVPSWLIILTFLYLLFAATLAIYQSLIRAGKTLR